MISKKNSLLLGLTLVSMIGCSNKTGLLDSATSVANEQHLADLNSLMMAHPEFSKASLKDIKTAAQGTNDTNNAMDLQFATEATISTGPLDQGVAKKAQDLIDNILEDFNLEAQLSADFKIIGIAMNLQHDVIEKMEKTDSLTGKSSFPNEIKAADNAVEIPKDSVKIPTCEQFIDNPFGEMPKEKIMTMLKRSHDELKTTISGCAKIQGQPFVQCMEYFNKMAGLVNKHASCNMRNFEDLTKIAEKEFKKSFSDIQHASRDCMNNQFSKCGFELDKNQQQTPPVPNNPNTQQ